MDSYSKLLEIPSAITATQAAKIKKLNNLLLTLDPSCPSVLFDERIRKAYQRIETLLIDNVTISIDEICHLNKLIGCEGKLRGPIMSPWDENNIAIREYEGAPADDLKYLLHEYTNRYNTNIQYIEPLLQICGAYLIFELLHPFKNGNGRTGRLIMAWLMRANNYKILAPFLETKWGSENRQHGKRFESHIRHYLAWIANPNFTTYFMGFFDYFLEELLSIALLLQNDGAKTVQ